jgi:proteasome lid subunit RPN8/RPN11
MAKAHFERLRRNCEACYPHEACGVLLGHVDSASVRTVHSVVQCSNACLESPHSRYSIDPGDLIRLQREARDRGQAIIGFYHSHPDSPSRWSPADLNEAHWTGCCYVITAVDSGWAAGTNSFVLIGAADARRFEEEPIDVY